MCIVKNVKFRVETISCFVYVLSVGSLKGLFNFSSSIWRKMQNGDI